jgi:glycosyltransferase involved in cell wall biosynthesis
MRVVQIIPGLITESSGPTYCLLRLVESIRAHGCQPTIATLDLSGSIRLPEPSAVFPVLPGTSRLGVSPRMRRWLLAQARTGGVDLIHSHGLWMMPNVYPGPISCRYRVPLVVTTHGALSSWAFRSGSLVKRPFWRLYQRRTLEQATVIHATSDMEASDIRRHGLRSPIAVIPNGIDVPPIDRLGAKSATPTVGFIGRIHPVKGIDTLLSAWSRLELRFPDWQLAIAGPDQHEYANQMKRLASGLGLRKVRFLGEIVGARKAEFLRAISVSVLPTHSENFGVSVAESLASATPAIVTRCAPWQGLADHGAGWWIEDHVDALEAALSEAMQTSPEYLEELGKAGHRWMAREFAWPRVGDMVAQTYRWATGRGARPPWIRT